MKWSAGGLAIAVLFGALPVQAQDASSLAREDRVTLNILRECARIADATARVACYDRNIGADIAQGGQAARAGGVAASPVPTPPAPSSPVAAQPLPQFGANQLPASPRPESQRVDRIKATVSAATQRAPGIWLLTLADGTQWQLVDAAPGSFDPPRKGSEIEIAAASLGSYILRYRGQTGLRIRRVS